MHDVYPKIGVFGGFRDENLKLYFSKPQKALPCAETRLLTHYAWKSVLRWGLYPSWWTAKKVKKKYYGGAEGVYFTYMPGKTPSADFYKNGLFQLAPDVITPSKFDLEILTGNWFAGVQILGPPIYCVHRSYKQSPAYRGSQWLEKNVHIIWNGCKKNSKLCNKQVMCASCNDRNK